uniref:Uncharacterized protein n=1 Tax=Panagrolaimus sp. ES5 TaxID=591445 RepID=A0AC34FHD4_9BILA
METRSATKIKNAAAAKDRYNRLSEEEKKALNRKRAQEQKRQRQRNKELAQLESILRQTNDIIDDPELLELHEKRMKAKLKEAEDLRYQRMPITVKNENDENIQDYVTTEKKARQQNVRKAAAARARYHNMTPEKQKAYNQRRSETFRRRRLEDAALLALPIDQINGEILERVQKVIIQNAKRSENARLKYQRMTPEERKEYNRKRKNYYQKKNVKKEEE